MSKAFETPALRRDRQDAMYQRALASLPGGTNSNFRAWGDATVYVVARQGRARLGHRRQRVRRPAHGLRPGHPRPRRRSGRRLRQPAHAAGHDLLADDRGRGPRRRAGQGADRLGRDGAHDGLGHRGHDARHAPGSRLHGADEDRQVRGPVPRRPRLRPDQRHAELDGGPRRSRQPGRPGLGSRHPRGDRGDDHPGTLQRPRLPAPALRATWRGDRLGHRRAGPGQRAGHPTGTRLPRRAPGPDPRSSASSSTTTRSRPAFASLAAGPRSSSASRPTSRPTPRPWATATRSPRSVAGARSWPCCPTR